MRFFIEHFQTAFGAEKVNSGAKKTTLYSQ